jgi:hypothetical protein
MSWELLTLIFVVVFAVVMIAMSKNPYVKKYWKYSLILVPGVLLIIFRLILVWREKKQTSADSKADNTLISAMDNIKKDIQEAQLTSSVEVAVAKTKSAEMIKALEEVKKIENKDERIKKLAEMVG